MQQLELGTQHLQHSFTFIHFISFTLMLLQVETGYARVREREREKQKFVNGVL
jgi:hypothetical protein